MIFSKIIGTGGYLPEKIVTNYDLEQKVDTTHQWIFERTGIVERHIANVEETTTQMGAHAARRAIEAAGISPDDIEMVIVATCTPDRVFPATACLIQAELGLPVGPAFDIQAVCSGFMYALSVADQFIRTGTMKRILVIGSEVMSRVIDWTDRKTCILFGDGAGAVVLAASAEPGILSCSVNADGRYKEALYLENHPVKTLQMQGNVVFRLAVNILDKIAASMIAKHGLIVSDIDWLVPHQANIRIIEATAGKLNLPMERVILTLQNQGNTSAASIPLALDTAIRDGRIIPGQRILLEAVGGGLTWGTALLMV